MSHGPQAESLRALRILFVIDELEALHGGSERQLIQLIQLLKNSGEQVELAILRRTEWLTEEETGCPIHFCRVGSLKSLSGIWALLKFAAWIRAGHFDAVQTMFVEANLVGPILAKFAGVPLVLGSRRNLNYWMSRQVAILQSFSNRFATRLVANSQAVRKAVSLAERTPESKIDVLYNGIECHRFVPSPEAREQTRKNFGVPAGAFLVGCISAIRPVKGVDVLVRSAAIVKQKTSSICFMLVGNGQALPEMQQLAAQLGVTESCIFTDARLDVLPFLSAFDAAVLPSRSEGFSNSLLEYMAAGLPIIATAVGGNPETLDNSGLLVPANDPELMADAILKLCRDRDLRKHLASSGLDRVRTHFNIDTTKGSLHQYFRHWAAICDVFSR